MEQQKEISAIELLERQLIFGDKKEIAKAAKCSTTDVDRFFKGVKGKYYKAILTEVIKKARANRELDQKLKDAAA